MRRKNDIREVELEIERPADRASREEGISYEGVSLIASGYTGYDGSKTTSSQVLFTASEIRYLEYVTATMDVNRADSARFVVEVRDENDAVHGRYRFHAGEHLSFDPADKLKDGWDVNVVLANPCPFEIRGAVFGVHRAEVSDN